MRPTLYQHVPQYKGRAGAEVVGTKGKTVYHPTTTYPWQPGETGTFSKECEMAEAMEHKSKKKHLHQVRTEAAHDGSYVHHHTYKEKKEDPHTEPERQNVATSGDAEEAGQHVSDSFAQNEGAAPAGEPEGGAAEAGGGAPDEAAGAEPGE